MRSPISKDAQIAEAVLHVLRRITWSQVVRLGEQFGLCRSDEQHDREALPARLLLFVLEAERERAGDILKIPTFDELATHFYAPPSEQPPSHEDMLGRRRGQIEIDDERVRAPLSNFEHQYWIELGRDIGDTVTFDEPIDRRVTDAALARTAAHFGLALPKKKGCAQDPTAFGRRVRLTAEQLAKMRARGRPEAQKPRTNPWAHASPADADDADPRAVGPMRAFFAFQVRAWDPDDQPWLEPPDELVNVRRLAQALRLPRTVNQKHTAGTLAVQPVPRARERILDPDAPTGMIIRVRRYREQPGVVVDEAELPELLEELRDQGVSARTAMVEAAELLGALEPRDDGVKLAIRLVSEVFPNGSDQLPKVGLPGRRALDHLALRWGDMVDIESWTTDSKVRWALFEILRRLKSSMDNTGLVRFPSAWITKPRDAGAFKLFSEKTFLGPGHAQEILDEHCWRIHAKHVGRTTAAAHEWGGGAARVYQVRYVFDERGAEVFEELLRDRWGDPPRKQA